MYDKIVEAGGVGRTLTSAWIETVSYSWSAEGDVVALSRVRGLKLLQPFLLVHSAKSHSHECVD